MSLPSAPSIPLSPAERRSRRVLAGGLGLGLVAVFLPDIPAEWLHGLLWTVAGLMMALAPPMVRIPKGWFLLAAGFIGFSCLGFLPRDWFGVRPWRSGLEELGVSTGPAAFVQARLSMETLAGLAVSTVFSLYLLGHRVGAGNRHRLLLAFALGIAAYAAAAIFAHQTDEIFGFFSNRNHTATLLAMGLVAGSGSLIHAVRHAQAWPIGLSLAASSITLTALLAFSESRAGILLAGGGLLALLALLGPRYLAGHAGKVISLLVFSAVGFFLIHDSKVRSRLADSLGRLEVGESPVEVPAAGTHPPLFGVGETPRKLLPVDLDGRLSIHEDTWRMIRGEALSGVGPGQFPYVFPQYREKSTAANDSVCLHPESDWLMLIAENGVLAAGCLLAGLLTAGWRIYLGARDEKSKALNMALLVAALVVPFHGLFDVPGHQVGIAWLAVLLLALAQRLPRAQRSHPAHHHGYHRTGRALWRIAGGGIAAAGLILLAAVAAGRPVLSGTAATRLVGEVRGLYEADRAAVTAGAQYNPAADQDLLGEAWGKLEQAIELRPLEPRYRAIQGILALHDDDKEAMAMKAFAIERHLMPGSVSIPVNQSRNLVASHPEEMRGRWQEAMERARAEELRDPNSRFNRARTLERILPIAATDPSLWPETLELVRGNPSLLGTWLSAAPVSLVDPAMPVLIKGSKTPGQRDALFQVWRGRGTKSLADEFERGQGASRDDKGGD